MWWNLIWVWINIYDVTFMRSLESSILCRIFHTGIAKRRQTIYSTNERAHCNFHVNLTTVIVVAPLLFCYYPRKNLDFKGHHYWKKTMLKCFFSSEDWLLLLNGKSCHNPFIGRPFLTLHQLVFRINFVLFFFFSVTLVGGVVFILFAVSALFFGGEETWY